MVPNPPTPDARAVRETCLRCGEPILPEHEKAIGPDGPIHWRGGCNGKSGKMFGREVVPPDDGGHRAPHAKRFQLCWEEGISCMEERANGPYVEHEAYEALRQQYDHTRSVLAQRVQTLEAEVKSYEESDEAMEAKLESLAPHGTCGCSYDAPGDVCLHHSPQLSKAAQRVKTLEEALDASIDERDGAIKRGAAMRLALQSLALYQPRDTWYEHVVRDVRAVAKAALDALAEPTP